MATARARKKAAIDDSPSDALLAKFARGLGDPTRLRILRLLLEKPRSVNEIIGFLSAPQSRVSNHLACLKWCGYVATERQGRTITYRVIDARVRTVIELILDIVADNSDHIASCARIAE